MGADSQGCPVSESSQKETRKRDHVKKGGGKPEARRGAIARDEENEWRKDNMQRVGMESSKAQPKEGFTNNLQMGKGALINQKI